MGTLRNHYEPRAVTGISFLFVVEFYDAIKTRWLVTSWEKSAIYELDDDKKPPLTKKKNKCIRNAAKKRI